MMLADGDDHLLPRKCDPRKCPEEINRENAAFFRRGVLSGVKSERKIANSYRNSGLLRERLARFWRESENPRLGGCAERLRRTSLRSPNSQITGKYREISQI
jgi:hypothetical protein